MAFYCVEDDAGIRDIELYALQAAGYEAVGFEDADACWQALQKDPLPQLILLDVMLPGMEGTELLRRIRAVDRLCRIPVILATAKGAEYDRIRGLDLGADYYLTKPFSVLELLARVRSLLRRMEMNSRRPVQPEEPDDLVVGDLTFSAEANTISCNGKGIGFTQTELRMLSYMMQKPGKAYARDKLLETIWGYETEVETRVTDETLRRIRRKLSLAGSSVCVQTIWGYGYKLEVSEPVK